MILKTCVFIVSGSQHGDVVPFAYHRLKALEYDSMNMHLGRMLSALKNII